MCPQFRNHKAFLFQTIQHNMNATQATGSVGTLLQLGRYRYAVLSSTATVSKTSSSNSPKYALLIIARCLPVALSYYLINKCLAKLVKWLLWSIRAYFSGWLIRKLSRNGQRKYVSGQLHGKSNQGDKERYAMLFFPFC